MPVYLRMCDPYVSDHQLCGATGTYAGKIIEAARKAGHDGVIFASSDMLGFQGATYVVFSANQVKSAIGNRGTYSSQSISLTDGAPDPNLAAFASQSETSEANVEPNAPGRRRRFAP